MTFQAGQSGNPFGRPPGLGRYIRQATMEGQELVDWVLKVARGEDPRTKAERAANRRVERRRQRERAKAKGEGNVPPAPAHLVGPRVTMRDRKWAVTWLADRGWGRPAIQLLAVVDGADAPSDLTRRRVLRACSNEELDMLVAIAQRLQAQQAILELEPGQPPPSSGQVIEGEPSL